MRKVYGYIESVLRNHGPLQREEVFKAVQSTYGVSEGDIGKRLREMKPRVECRYCPVTMNGKTEKKWLYFINKQIAA